jgi:hypothetical protein
MKRRSKKILIGLAVFLVILGGLGGFYLMRPPVVLVVDDAFLTLHGKKRADMRRYLLSATLLRRVAFALVAQDADQDAPGFAVNAVSPAPFMALFPERYLGGADRYAAAIEAAGLSGRTRTVVVNSGDGRGVSIGKAESLRIDRETDLYRAGMCAAVLAKGNTVAVYSQTTLPQALREAFIAGLTAAGHAGEPLFSRNTESVSGEGIGCAVMLSAVNTSLLAARQSIPIILFSWMDPEYTPGGVAVVFDDSLLAVAGQAARGNSTLTASAHILPKRVRAPADLKTLVTAITAKWGGNHSIPR